MNKQGFTHESPNNKSVDWYTPKYIFDKLNVYFDLDPCQPKQKLDWIPCKEHYYEEIDGLKLPWSGSVWLNPPYGKTTKEWLAKMHVHRNGIALVFARTDTKFFHDYVARADAICFLKGRIKFIDGLGITSTNGAGAGSMLVAWGIENVTALQNFKHDGLIVYPDK